ncbi:hypothetical protein AYO41_05190 [Verrucomicrobia bacterium SCGC AG-212-E04]|nr:hypothetical protein AYO41_05190 [Verrucomicrobia bacterium SCGC AG-212-E04]
MNRLAACSLVLLLSLVPALRAGEPVPISPVALDAYYKITAALAADSLDGVVESSKAFANAVKDPMLQLAATNVAAATQVDLPKTREMFVLMNTILADGLKFGDYRLEQGTTYRVYCPMKQAEWLQSAQVPIRNPYHGAEMLECGAVIDTYAAKK